MCRRRPKILGHSREGETPQKNGCCRNCGRCGCDWWRGVHTREWQWETFINWVSVLVILIDTSVFVMLLTEFMSHSSMPLEWWIAWHVTMFVVSLLMLLLCNFVKGINIPYFTSDHTDDVRHYYDVICQHYIVMFFMYFSRVILVWGFGSKFYYEEPFHPSSRLQVDSVIKQSSWISISSSIMVTYFIGLHSYLVTAWASKPLHRHLDRVRRNNKAKQN